MLDPATKEKVRKQVGARALARDVVTSIPLQVQLAARHACLIDLCTVLAGAQLMQHTERALPLIVGACLPPRCRPVRLMQPAAGRRPRPPRQAP